MKTLYMCQASTGLLAFTYAQNGEEAMTYFTELFTQYSPTWLNSDLNAWHCPEGWMLPPTEGEYNFTPPKHPYYLDEVKTTLQGYNERREKRKKKRASS